MKNPGHLATLCIIIASCQAPTPPAAEEAVSAPKRYTTSAPEIDAAKAGMSAYLNGDWETFRSGFAENAKIYHNSTKSMSLDETITTLQEGLQVVSSYGIDHEQYWERIISDDGETWVYFWGTWKAQHASSDSQFEVPFHMHWHYVEGKVVEEYGLWDNSPVMQAEMEAAKEIQ